MAEDKRSEQEGEAKFNFALARLEGINEILMNIVENEKKLAVNLSASQVQVIKKRLVKQLFVQAFPLLKEEDKETIGKKISGIILKLNKTGYEKGSVISTSKVNEELDDCIIDIEKSMQKQGKFFMPSKDEGSMF